VITLYGISDNRISAPTVIRVTTPTTIIVIVRVTPTTVIPGTVIPTPTVVGVRRSPTIIPWIIPTAAPSEAPADAPRWSVIVWIPHVTIPVGVVEVRILKTADP
jgi:hypothetical protein